MRKAMVESWIQRNPPRAVHEAVSEPPSAAAMLR